MTFPSSTQSEARLTSEQLDSFDRWFDELYTADSQIMFRLAFREVSLAAYVEASEQRDK